MKIYHGIPENMIGDELVPLNQLKTNQPTLAGKYLEKYKGREEVMERRVPLLDCLWNDVVQFLPLHPRLVFAKQVELGLIPSVPPYKFFEIEIEKLDPSKCVVFFKTAPGEENVTVKWLSDVSSDELRQIPQATLDYYKTLEGTGELPFNYQFIPHILYHGSVKVSDSLVITL